MLLFILVISVIIAFIAAVCAIASDSFIRSGICLGVFMVGLSAALYLFTYGYHLAPTVYTKLITTDRVDYVAVCENSPLSLFSTCYKTRKRVRMQLVPVENPVWVSTNSTSMSGD